MKHGDRPLHIKSKLARDEEHAGWWFEQKHLIISDEGNIVDQYVVAECLHITERTVRTWTRRGFLQANSIGRKPYYRENDVLEVMHRRKAA